MKHRTALGLMMLMVCAGCVSTSSPPPKKEAGNAPGPAASLLEQSFVFEVLRHVYRWHFDQSYALEAGKVEELEVWARPLHPKLDTDDRSEYGEMWIPAVKTLVELKRAEYNVPELKLEINERTFKVTRVTRLARPPASRQQYQVREYPLPELRDYLFATRTNRVLLSETLRASARKLIADYLAKAHPEPFSQDQTFYISPLSGVCSEIWVFWETGRKVMLFTADMDLTSPRFSQLSQLRMQVIDLDKDVVASTREVPGSNAFVTKDWVGRLFFNCIMYGEKLVRTPDEIRRARAEAAARPAP
jgi:hypothetical protein